MCSGCSVRDSGGLHRLVTMGHIELTYVRHFRRLFVFSRLGIMFDHAGHVSFC